MNITEYRHNALNCALLADLEGRWHEAEREWETALPEGQIEAAERMRAAWHELAKVRNARVWG